MQDQTTKIFDNFHQPTTSPLDTPPGTGTPDNDLGPGWCWAFFLLPYIEQANLYNQIQSDPYFEVPYVQGTSKKYVWGSAGSSPLLSSNTLSLCQTSVKVYQCPSDPYQQPCVLHFWSGPGYSSATYTSSNSVTVAHSNYLGCVGWEECFNNVDGNPEPAPGTAGQPGGGHGPGDDGLSGGWGKAGDGIFYRNSHNRVADVTDGMSNTIFVGERCASHSPSTWTAAIATAMCPAWMATTPYTVPYTPKSQAPSGPNLTAYDNADWGEALVVSHCNATHLPSADYPSFDPDTYYSMHAGKGANFVFGDGSVHFLANTIDPNTYQHLATIADGEVLADWD